MGDDANDYSGYSVASGDINNDNKTDIIIGAYLADPAGGSAAGETYVIYGGSYSVGKVFDLNSVSANITVLGDDANDYSGAAVASGDTNNINIFDIIIGAPLADPTGGSDAGETYIIFGPNNPPYFTSHLNNQTYPKYNENINLSININNDRDIDYVWFSTNDSGSWVNYSFKPNAITLHKNWTILKVASTRDTLVGYSWYANDTVSNINKSKNDTDNHYFFKVKNTVPILTSNPAINDTTPVQNAIINCSTGNYSESADLDQKNKDFWRWYLNDEILEGKVNSTLFLDSISESYENLIICSQKVYDGYGNSSNWYNSSIATVTELSRIYRTEVGSGGKTTKTASINILSEPFLLIYRDESIVAPLTIKNTGSTMLYDINLETETNNTDLTFEFTKDQIELLRPGQEAKSDLIITSSGQSNLGYYEVLIKANVKNPPFSDSLKLFLNLITRSAFNETTAVTRVTFAKDLFKENPECLEFNELLNEAEKNMEEGQFKKAIELTGSAVEACRVIVVSRKERIKEKPNLLIYAIITIIITIIFIVALYLILKPRRRLYY